MRAVAMLIAASACCLSGVELRAEPMGDVARGEQVYEAKCSGCHSLDANRVGPAHRGVVGRKVGSAPGFTYSEALHKARFTWTAQRLDRWLTDPSAYLPGARMGFRLADPQARADVIAYLARQK
jgi:cytochrome c